jgi:type IV pilus assembly protein PilQ
MLEGFSRITVEAGGGCEYVEPAPTREGLVLTVKNCSLPKKLQRTFDTRAFAGNVRKITPYQVKAKGKTNTKIVVALRTRAPYALKRTGKMAVLEIRNPENGTAKHDAIPERRPATQPAIQAEIAKTGSVDQPTAGKKQYKGRRVTLEFSDADIRKIFQLIAEVSNLNFLLGDDVTGTISIKLVNVPWDQALDVILETKGLGMRQEGNIVVIRPIGKIQSLADEQAAQKKAFERTLEPKTKVYDVNFAGVQDIATMFNSVKSERGIIAQDPRTNRVIVTDIQPSIEKMDFLLKALDVPEKQVVIEARIVEATSTVTRDLGIQWGLHATNVNTAGITDVDAGFGGILPAGSIGTAGTFGPGVAAGITFGKVISGGTLDLQLSALATAEQIKIISSPKVVTLNNKAAKIAQGQSIPYSTTSAEGTKTEFVEAALTLEVTPHITADGSVAMKIKATNNTAGTGSPPPINKKEATTELLVKNGETTVIGGIYVDNDTQSDTGVPFLKDIPLLGHLFKSTSKFKQKSELLIFITPRIVAL